MDQDREAIMLASKLRRKRISCSMFFGKVGKGLEYGNAMNVPYVIIVGSEEVKAQRYTLKDLSSGKEKKLDIDEIVDGFI